MKSAAATAAAGTAVAAARGSLIGAEAAAGAAFAARAAGGQVGAEAQIVGERAIAEGDSAARHIQGAAQAVAAAAARAASLPKAERRRRAAGGAAVAAQTSRAAERNRIGKCATGDRGGASHNGEAPPRASPPLPPVAEMLAVPD